MELNSLGNGLFVGLAVALFVGWSALLWWFPAVALWTVVLMSCVSMFTLAFYFFAHTTVSDPAPQKFKTWPSISILIPCYNSMATLPAALDSIRAMQYPGKTHIIVLDDSSTDGTFEYASNIKGITVVRRTGLRGKAATLNQGIGMVKDDLVACIDSDTYPPADALVKMVPFFYTGRNVGAVTAFITVAHPGNTLQRMQELEYYNSFGFVAKTMSKINGLMVTPGPMSIYRRDVLEKVGGFDEGNMTEDMEIGLRLQDRGYVIECASDAIVPTEVPNTLKKLYRQRVRWYRGTLFNLKKYGHMLFNPKFSDFGLFSFPSTLIYVIFTLCLSGVLLYNLASSAGEGAAVFWSWLKVAQGAPFSFGGLLFNSISLFLLISFAAWLYFVLKSVSMAHARLGLRHLVPAFALVLFYPALITFFYVSSFFKEVGGAQFSWQ